MKFGFLGNTNNLPFRFACLLRKMGHSVFFVVTEKELLHRPESRDPEFRQGYPEWIMDVSHLTEWDFMTLHPELASVLSLLSRCDALILNSYGPSLLPFIDRPGIAFLTGSDLSYYANYSSVDSRTSMWATDYRESAEARHNLALLTDFITRQRRGIKKAVAVRYFARGSLPDDDKLLDDMGIPDSRRFFFRSADLDRIQEIPAPHNEPLRVFCGARFTWKLPIEPGRSHLDYKGLDIMIRGLALFHRETATKLDIQFVRKGLHLNETMELIDEEGLADQITWSNEMSLTGFWEACAQADIVFDQLGDGLIGGAGLDAMAIGRPVIANAGPEGFEDLFGEVPPICRAKTPEEVYAQLKRLAFNQDERDRIGRSGRQYMEKYFNPEHATQQIVEIFQQAIHDVAEQKAYFEVDYMYILQALHDLRLASQQELALSLTVLERYKRFFRPFRFLLDLLRKIPRIKKLLINFPQE